MNNSKYFVDAALKDEEFCLEVLNNYARNLRVQLGVVIPGAREQDERALREATREALAAFPHSQAIKAFAEKHGIEL